MEHLSSLDAGMFHVETAQAPLHLGAVLIAEGPAPCLEEFVDALRLRLSSVPRHRQRVRTVPFGHPVWTEDPAFDLGFHLRHTAVPPPGDVRDLEALASRVFCLRLDPSRPPWELWLVEGLSEGKWAVLAKAQHSLIDGTGGADLFTSLLDVCRQTSWVGDPPPWPPPGPPGRLRLLAHGLKEAAFAPIAWSGTIAPGLRDLLTDLPSACSRLIHHQPSPMPGAPGSHRRWISASADLTALRRAHQRLNVPVNDLVLTAVASGIRALLSARGELSETTRVPCLTPVAIGPTNRVSIGTARLSAAVIDLPCGLSDAKQRLDEVHLQTGDRGIAHHAGAATALLNLADHFPMLLSSAANLATALAKPRFQTSLINVPGPSTPRYVLGREILAIHPYSPVGAGVPLAVAVISYRSRLCFGFTGDWDASPDLDILADGILNGIAELTQGSNTG